MSNKKIEVQTALSPDPRSVAAAHDLGGLIMMGVPPTHATEVALLILADIVVHTPGNRASNIAKAKEMLAAHIERAEQEHESCLHELEERGIQTNDDMQVH